MEKTKEEISIEATEYAKRSDPLNQTLEKQADIRMGYISGYDSACTSIKAENERLRQFFKDIRYHKTENADFYQAYVDLKGIAKEALNPTKD